MSSETPRWHREALERHIDWIVLTYSKAEGFVFCPTNLELPFRVGGDYDGSFPVSAEGALRYIERNLHPAYVDEVVWIAPFIQRIVNDEDFSLDELQLSSRKVRLIRGKWPW